MSAAVSEAGEILVAVKFDAATAALVELAQRLADTSGQKLRLVHVLSRELPLHMPERDRGDDLTLMPEALITGTEALTSRMQQAHRRLADLADRKLNGLVRFGTDVIIGEFPDALTEYSVARAATLVIAGAARRHPGLLKARMRRTCRLMARMDVPVLVVPDTRNSRHAADGMIRFLIADDLSAAALPALRVVTNLIDRGIRGDVLHLHVTPTPMVDNGGDADGSWEIWPGISVEDRLYNDHHEHLLDRLHDRAARLRANLQRRQGRYAAELWQGNVREEISRATTVHQPDLTVFGRHHFLKRQPFSLGQMPFLSMLGVGSAVLVAPDSTQYS